MSTYQKSVASFVLICFSISFFTLPPEAWASLQAPGFPLEITPEGKDFSASFVPLGIPPEIASIEEVFIPDPKKSTAPPVIHIQSVHAHPETQKKIYALLKFLDEKYGIGSMFIEGAAEQLNPDFFHFFDENRLNVRVAEKLVEKGELTGAELFLVESHKKIPAYGIEDPSLYRENLTSFQTVMLQRPLTSQFTSETHSFLDRLETVLLTPETRKLLRSNESFDAGQLELLSYAHELERRTKSVSGLDLRNFENQLEWPQMIRLLRLQEVETGLDPEKIQSERERLVSFLREIKIEPLLVESFQNLAFSPFQSGMVYDPGFRPNDLPRYLAERLVAATREKGFSFDQYPYFTRYLEAAILQSELEAGRLFDEMERLFETLVRSVSKKEEELTFTGLVQKDRLFERLFDLELTPKDYAKIQTVNETPRPLVRFLLDMESLHEKTPLGKTKLVPDNIETLESVYGQAIRFYQLAKEREEKMADKILDAIATKQPPSSEIARGSAALADVSASSETPSRNDKKGVTILITGGFHTEGLSHTFRKKQVPYTIVSPRVTEKVSPEAYVSMLLGEKKTAFDTQYLEPAVKAISRAMRARMLSEEAITQEIKTVLQAVLESALEEKMPAGKTVNRVNNSPYANNRRFALQLSKSGDSAMIWGKMVGDFIRDGKRNYIVIPMDTVRVEFQVLAARSAPKTLEELAEEFDLPSRTETSSVSRKETKPLPPSAQPSAFPIRAEMQKKEGGMREGIGKVTGGVSGSIVPGESRQPLPPGEQGLSPQQTPYASFLMRLREDFESASSRLFVQNVLLGVIANYVSNYFTIVNKQMAGPFETLEVSRDGEDIDIKPVARRSETRNSTEKAEGPRRLGEILPAVLETRKRSMINEVRLGRVLGNQQIRWNLARSIRWLIERYGERENVSDLKEVNSTLNLLATSLEGEGFDATQFIKQAEARNSSLRGQLDSLDYVVRSFGPRSSVREKDEYQFIDESFLAILPNPVPPRSEARDQLVTPKNRLEKIINEAKGVKHFSAPGAEFVVGQIPAGAFGEQLPGVTPLALPAITQAFQGRPQTDPAMALFVAHAVMHDLMNILFLEPTYDPIVAKTFLEALKIKVQETGGLDLRIATLIKEVFPQRSRLGALVAKNSDEPGGQVLVLDHLPNKFELLNVVSPVRLNKNAFLEIAFTPEVAMDEKTRQEFKSEVRRLVPEGRVEILHYETRAALSKALLKGELGRRFLQRISKVTRVLPFDSYRFAEQYVVVNLPETEKAAIQELDPTVQAVLYALDRKNPNFASELAAVSLIGEMLARRVLPEDQKRKYRTSTGRYRVSEDNLEEFMASMQAFADGLHKMLAAA